MKPNIDHILDSYPSAYYHEETKSICVDRDRDCPLVLEEDIELSEVQGKGMQII